MKKDWMVMIVVTFGALTLLMGASFYHRYKVAGERIARIQIYYFPGDPKGRGVTETLVWQASGEQARRVGLQLQTAPSWPRLPGGVNASFWLSSPNYAVITTRRDQQKSKCRVELASGLALGYFPGHERELTEQPLTAQSLHYFRALLASKNR